MGYLEDLKNLTLAPYVLQATALIGVSRKVGGNQFRHSFAVLGILFDYKYFDDPILLKAALLHDLLEDYIYEIMDDDFNKQKMLNEIMDADSDGPAVLELVREVTRNKDVETKIEYLQRLKNASFRAKILKCADRIQNLTDLHLDTHTDQNILEYLKQTEDFILPLAREVKKDFEKEIIDLIIKRKDFCEKSKTN